MDGEVDDEFTPQGARPSEHHHEEPQGPATARCFNLGWLMRSRFGFGKPRCLQGRTVALWAALIAVVDCLVALLRLPVRHSFAVEPALPRIPVLSGTQVAA